MTTFHCPLRRVVLAAAMLLVAASFVHGQQTAGDKERELIEVLRSGQPAQKALACKHLVIHGSKASVPELARLLGDEQLASWARIALEAIPDPAADAALREALGSLQGKLLIGVINSLGVRRDARAAEPLAALLKGDAEVASAAAAALGQIGTDAAAQQLQQALSEATGPVRDAAAEGLVLCAERRLNDGKFDQAAALYDQVRQAEVSPQRLLEATRGAILARRTGGIPLLLEQLRSPDRRRFQIGLSTARELPGREVAAALAAELGNLPPQRGALVLYALADRPEAALSPAVVEAARSGSPEVRVAAIGLMGRVADPAALEALLDLAADENAEVARAAAGALAEQPGKDTDREILARLGKAQGNTLRVLIEAVGRRRIDDAPALVKFLDHPDAEIRHAALAALGETVGPKELSLLIQRVLAPTGDEELQAALRAVRAAAVRMPDREATAAQLTSALSQAPTVVQAGLLEILAAMGGPTALRTIAEATGRGEELLVDTGSRLLGQWMSVDAAPALLDLAKKSDNEKYRQRALRGYIRLARQFAMPEAQRAQMCRTALNLATRDEERELVLAVLERYPGPETLQVAIAAAELPGLKDKAIRTVLAVAQKLGGDSSQVRELLSKAGLKPVKVEILKAEYGAGNTFKDVTDVLRRQVSGLPLVPLPAASYNESLGGDPVPGKVKQLKVHYRIDGKTGEAVFAENSPIVLPIPK